MTIKETQPSTTQPMKEQRFTRVYASSFIVYQTALKILLNIKSQSIETSRQTIQVAQQYMQQYPTLRTFLYSSVILSIVPVGIFSLVLVSTLLLSIGTAMTSIFLVQSGVFFVGMTMLVPVEIGIFCIAGGAALLVKSTGTERFLEYPQKVMNKYESFLIREESDDTIVM
jgi:hypothetical protein